LEIKYGKNKKNYNTKKYTNKITKRKNKFYDKIKKFEKEKK